MLASSDGLALPRATPESQGLASAALLRFIDALERQNEIHSFMLLRHGRVIAEGWWSPYAPEHQHMLFSLSKSFTATAVGLAVAEGRFALEDTVASFFPQEAALGQADELAAMQVRHLLSMSTGQAVDTWSYMVDRADGNWVKGFLEVPVLHTPGTHFVYNTGATYMLSAIVQQTTGMKLVDYLQPRLFAPLGIEGARWQDSPQGITAGGIGLYLKTEDVAKFGQLYLQKGRWQGQQLLSEAWVEAATAVQIANSDGVQADWSQGYGYQFWRCRHHAYRGDGVFGQYCIVMPEQETVLAITSGIDIFEMQQPLNLVWEILLPALQADPLPATADHEALAAKLASLRMPPVQGQVTTPLAPQVSGRVYVVEANTLGIETIAFSFGEADCNISITTATMQAVMPCGYGSWQGGQATSLFSQALLFASTPITASGAWTAAEVFTIIARLHETPFYHTLVCHFVGDELLIEIRINVSLESLAPLLLLGHASKQSEGFTASSTAAAE